MRLCEGRAGLAAPESERHPRIRVAALIVLKGRVVVVRHRKGERSYHLLPGGGVDFGESLAAALVREVAEETGLTIAVRRPLLLSDTIAPDATRHVVNIVFDATIVSGSITDRSADPRVEAVELVSPESLGALDLRPPIAEAITRALSSRSKPTAKYLGELYTPE